MTTPALWIYYHLCNILVAAVIMTGNTLQAARRQKGWTQVRAAREFRVSQGYVALLEAGHRRPSPALQRRLAKALDLPPTAVAPVVPTAPMSADELGADLANLGYPGFVHLRRPRRAAKNPAGVLLSAVQARHLEPRMAEALPWLVLTYADLDWNWLMPQVKALDLQNKLGFVVTLARQLAERGHAPAVEALRAQEDMLEHSRLVREDPFGHTTITEAETRWLRVNRSPEARRWNVLSSLAAEHLSHAG